MENNTIFNKAEEYNFEKKIDSLKTADIYTSDMTAIEQLVAVLAHVPAEKLNMVDGLIDAVEFKTSIRQTEVSDMKNYYSGSDLSLSIQAEDCTKKAQLERIRRYHREYKFYNEVYKPFLKAKYLISVAEYPEASGILSQFK